MILGICLLSAGLLIFRKYTQYQKDGEISNREGYTLGIMIFLIAVVAILGMNSFTTVEVVHAKLVIDPITGKIEGPHLGEKWFFRAPWTRTMDIYYATLSTEMWTNNELDIGHKDRTGEYSAVKVLSKDGLDIEVDILIRYSLDPSKLIQLFQKYPDLMYERKAISSVVREDVRDVISNYLTLEIIEERETLSVEMTQKIVQSLSTTPSLVGALIDIQIDLRDIDPPASFKTAVAEKKKAEQQKLQAEHERETKLIQADATAQESILLASGLAEASIIQANATRQALETITTQIPADIYYSLQQLEKIAPYVKFLILNSGDDGVPIYYQVPTTP